MTTRRYAEGTSVATDKSRAEIERTLQRYGATAFAYGWQSNKASIQFEAKGRRIRFLLPLPDRNDKRFTHTAAKAEARTESGAHAAWEQACRQSWRALLLIIKAKLEAVEARIVTFEDEFMSHIVLPSGQTVGEFMKPQIAIAYDRGTMPPLLPDYSKGGA
jgi:hypothetical protein